MQNIRLGNNLKRIAMLLILLLFSSSVAYAINLSKANQLRPFLISSVSGKDELEKLNIGIIEQLILQGKFTDGEEMCTYIKKRIDAEIKAMAKNAILLKKEAQDIIDNGSNAWAYKGMSPYKIWNIQKGAVLADGRKTLQSGKGDYFGNMRSNVIGIENFAKGTFVDRTDNYKKWCNWTKFYIDTYREYKIIMAAKDIEEGEVIDSNTVHQRASL